MINILYYKLFVFFFHLGFKKLKQFWIFCKVYNLLMHLALTNIKPRKILNDMAWFDLIPSFTLTVSLLLKKFNICPVVYSWYLKTVMWTHWVIYILSFNKIVAMLRMVPYDTCGREHAKLNIKTGFKKRWLKYEVGCFFLL